jgi:hypothetical protein
MSWSWWVNLSWLRLFLVFFFHFYSLILGWLGFEIWHFFFNLFSLGLSRSYNLGWISFLSIPLFNFWLVGNWHSLFFFKFYFYRVIAILLLISWIWRLTLFDSNFTISSFNIGLVEIWALCFFLSLFSMGLSHFHNLCCEFNKFTPLESNHLFFIFFFNLNFYSISFTNLLLFGNWVSWFVSICFLFDHHGLMTLIMNFIN